MQTLLFIRKNPYLHISPAALDTLANRLGIAQDECWLLIDELIDEGFVTPPPRGVRRFLFPLRLSPAGDGLLDWVRTRSAILADPRLAAGNPMLVVH